MGSNRLIVSNANTLRSSQYAYPECQYRQPECTHSIHYGGSNVELQVRSATDDGLEIEYMPAVGSFMWRTPVAGSNA